MQGIPWEASSSSAISQMLPNWPRNVLMCSQQFAGGLYPVLDECRSRTLIVFTSESVLNLCQIYDLSLDLPRGLSPSRLFPSILYVFLTPLFHAMCSIHLRLFVCPSLCLVSSMKFEARSPSWCCFLPLIPTYSLNHPVLKTPQPAFFP